MRDNYHIVCQVLGFPKIYNLWVVAIVCSLQRTKKSEIGLQNYFSKSKINKLWTAIWVKFQYNYVRMMPV